MTTQNVITRFAPSPTGYLHIGGARTALFNWLFAKHMGGQFKLRIEDTDKERSVESATRAIIEGLDWLGLKAEGDVVYQSQNAERHVAAALEMLERGGAYRCYLTPEELQAHKDADQTDTAFRSPYRDSDAVLDRPFTIRFRVPEGQTKIQDQVQGDITWDNKTFDDLVLLRADGTPTYMLAVVVDDHDMDVTHVIRGDDHLINAARQSLIYQALGWTVPIWAHVPLIHGPDGKKLSKRHGALGVEAYRDMGYLPEGLKNYLLKLGWSNGDQELFFGDEAVTNFTLEGLNSAAARLDFDKMDYINAQHIVREPDADLLDKAIPFIENKLGGPVSPDLKATLLKAVDTLKPRSKTLVEFVEQAQYLMLKRPIEISPRAAKSLKAEAVEYLRALIPHLNSLKESQWTDDVIQETLTTFATQKNVGFGKIGQPVRAALTGGAPSPDLAIVIALLGKNEVLARLSDRVEA